MKNLICFVLIFSMMTALFAAVPLQFPALAEEADIPYEFPSANQTKLFGASFEGSNPNYVDRTSKESITGKESPTSELLGNAFDGNTSTKYLTLYANDNSCYVEIKLAAATTVTTYLIASANDFPERDPAQWVLYGSNDGNDWTEADTQSGVVFEDRFEHKVFTVKNPGSYVYYKFVVMKTYQTNNYLQYSEFMLNPYDKAAAVPEPDRTENTLYGEPEGITLATEIGSGGIDGVSSLKVTAKHPKEVKGNGYALVYDAVNAKVSKNTRLSYCIKPESASGYDTNYPGHYMAVDLVFTDGTRLSEAKVTDQNGHLVTPYAQGATKTLVTSNWNYIEVDLSSLAGKTVDKILVGYDRGTNETGKDLNALAYFDSIALYDQAPETIVSKTQYVKTTRGTYYDNSSIFRGTAYPSVNVPNAMMKIAPATTSGSRYLYNYTATALAAFTVTHQASIHLLDYNQFQFMPSTVLNAASANASNTAASARQAAFSHGNEIDRANYYAVQFDQGTAASGVKTEITTTDHAAVARITFPSDAAMRTIIFDSIGAEVSQQGSITFGDDGTFTATVKGGHTNLNIGYSTMYIYGRFSAVPVAAKSVDNGLATGAVTFPADTEEVILQFAQSNISAQQAKKNLELEIADKSDFDGVLDASTKAWEEILDIIDIEGASREQLISVYSGLYRMYSYPTNYSENTGTAEEPKIQYMSPYTGKVTDGQMYTSNGFWDTYRTAWPAYSLLTPTKAGDFLDGVLQHYKDSGELARWLNPAGVPSMVGTSSDVIFGDAAVKGVEFDHETAFESILKNAVTTNATGTAGRINQDVSLFRGYVSNQVGTSVSWQIENNISDYAAALFAEKLGKTDYKEYLLNRSLGYTYLFEPEAGFFISRSPDGTFTASGDSLDPYLWNPNVYGHIETNAWGTAFTVAYDGEGLAALYGGKEAMAAKLDEMLSANQECTTAIGTQHEMFEGREVKMGQYWHSNQPAHATLYMYNYADQPYKTQQYTREALDRLYVGSSLGQGYIGDEDNGEQSAWYILSALGFYPLSLGSGQYAITSPLFDKVTLHLESGDVEIIAHNNGAENVYIQSMTVDGVAYHSTEISHEALIGAKKIEFTMGNTPSAWGVENTPAKSTATVAATPVPMADLVQPNFTFKGAISNTGNLVWCASGATSRRLYDNSISAATIGDEVGVHFETAKAVKMITVTSGGKAVAPIAVTVQASSTGEDGSWVDLASSTLSYTFNNQVIPVSLNNNTAYSYYRLQFTPKEGSSACSIAEIEWLGYETETPYGMEDLQKLKNVTDTFMKHTAVAENTNIIAAYNNAGRAIANGNVTDHNTTTVYIALKDALLTVISEEDLEKALAGDDITPSPTITYGDVNSDKAVNAKDALMILQAAVEKITLTEEQTIIANVNGDDDIDAKDALLVLQKAVDKIDKFPVEQ